MKSLLNLQRKMLVPPLVSCARSEFCLSFNFQYWFFMFSPFMIKANCVCSFLHNIAFVDPEYRMVMLK